MSSTSIEELRKKLIEDARKKAEEIISKAEEEAKRIIEEAEKEWERQAEAKRNEVIENARKKAQILLSEARTRARVIISRAKHEVLQKIFKDVEMFIREREGIDVETSLKNLLDESLKYIEKPTRITINPKDRGIIEKLLSEKGFSNIEINESNDIFGGLIIEDAEGKKVDNSYNTRFERAKTVLAPMINKELWGKGV